MNWKFVYLLLFISLYSCGSAESEIQVEDTLFGDYVICKYSGNVNSGYMLALYDRPNSFNIIVEDCRQIFLKDSGEIYIQHQLSDSIFGYKSIDIISIKNQKHQSEYRIHDISGFEFDSLITLDNELEKYNLPDSQ